MRQMNALERLKKAFVFKGIIVVLQHDQKVTVNPQLREVYCGIPGCIQVGHCHLID